VTSDDHEVENDYANDRSENLDHPEWFLARRAAAYKAFYEHMPMRRAMLPHGPHARIYTRAAFGNLANFFVLDDRQYRAPQACPRPGRGGSTSVDVAECKVLADPARLMLGREQGQWLGANLAASRAKWNILAQQTPMARFDQKPGPGRIAWTDGWDGYPAARRRLLGTVADKRVPGVVVLGGDVHTNYVADLRPDFDDPKSPVVASEFCGTSITSLSLPQSRIDAALAYNAHVRLARGDRRGYGRFRLDAQALHAELRVLDDARDPASGASTLARFVVEAGRPGPQPA
jgi:alkaline phosphatase D